MRLVMIAVTFATIPSLAYADWHTQKSRKAFSSFEPLEGVVATLPAKAAHNGVTARLQIECFTHPQLTGLSFGIVLSKAPPSGQMAWRFKYDDAPEVARGPYTRMLPPNAISLGDASSLELSGLGTASRLKLTLVPASGPTLPYEFDVRGASNAIKAIPCSPR